VGSRTARSLKHEYELFVEREIENYKDSLPRPVLLGIGDEAVRALARQSQLVLTELVLCEEVDRIIMERLRIPGYRNWRRRCLHTLEQYRRPEHWGLNPENPLVRSLSETAGESRVLVAGDTAERVAVYLAANGCEVTAVDVPSDMLERVLATAGAAGVAERVRPADTDIEHWTPEAPLNAVVCTPGALARLSPEERQHVIELLQTATADGGVHLVQTIIAGQEALSVAELRARYAGWQITVERDDHAEDGTPRGNGRGARAGRAFVARKSAA
jgi:methyltransferase family protein